MNNDKKKGDFIESSVVPDTSKTFDGQNLHMMQGIMEQKFDINADRRQSIWKTLRMILIIGVCAFSLGIVFYWMIFR